MFDFKRLQFGVSESHALNQASGVCIFINGKRMTKQ